MDAAVASSLSPRSLYRARVHVVTAARNLFAGSKKALGLELRESATPSARPSTDAPGATAAVRMPSAAARPPEPPTPRVLESPRGPRAGSEFSRAMAMALS